MKKEVDWARKTYEEVQQLYDDTLNPHVKLALLTGVHKANGQLASALHEIRELLIADRKGRHSGAQKYGDVHIGHKIDAFAKTIELKSKTDGFVTNVDKEIRKGLKQLQGLQEKAVKQPRPGDIWVLDVLIANPLNRWPLPGDNQQRETKSANHIIGAAKSRLEGLIKKEIADPLLNMINTGWTQVAEWWGIEETDKELEAAITTLGAIEEGLTSSRPVFVVTRSNEVEEMFYLPALTIKIRYGGAMEYPIRNEGFGIAIAEMKFQLRGQPITKSAFSLEHLGTKYTRA